jgi:predicted porin
LAALSAIAAQAQSTVTLYGLVDANFGRYTTNSVSGGAIKSLSQTKVDPAGLNGNRWGLRAKEDLGGGISAIFNLESGFNIDDGSQGQGTLFGRRANVGLTGGFGTVELGRSSSPYANVSIDHAMMGGSIADPSNNNNGLSITRASAIGTVVGAAQFLGARGVPNTTWLGFQERINNSVKYTSPNLSGFTGAVMVALGEDKTATTKASKTVSASVKYVNGPLLVSAGYQLEGVGGTLTGSVTPPATTLVTPTATPALENAIASVAYNFGVAKVGLGINRAKYKDVTLTTALNGATSIAPQNEYSLSVAVPLGATTLSAGYAQSNGDTLGKSRGFGVQALYALSKRTTLYAGAVSTSPYDKLADAVRVLAPASDIRNIRIYAAGIRHTF